MTSGLSSLSRQRMLAVTRSSALSSASASASIAKLEISSSTSDRRIVASPTPQVHSSSILSSSATAASNNTSQRRILVSSASRSISTSSTSNLVSSSARSEGLSSSSRARVPITSVLPKSCWLIRRQRKFWFVFWECYSSSRTGSIPRFSERAHIH